MRAVVPPVAAVLLAAAASLVSFAGDAAPPTPALPTKTFASADGRISIELPEAWALKPEKRDQAAVAWTGTLSDGGGEISVSVYSVPGLVNAREQSFAERDVHPGRYGVKGPAHVETDVLPHLWLDFQDAGAPMTRAVWMYRVVRRNGFTVHVLCAADAWPKIRLDCLRAAQSLTTTMEEWPTPPAGYARRVRDGIVYYVQPGAGDSDAAVHAIVRGEQQAFLKLHGAVSIPPESPLVVVVHAKSAGAAAGEEQHFEPETYRLVAVEPAKGDDKSRSVLVREARRAFIAQTFAGTAPFWLYCGESFLAWMEARSGRPAPSVLEGFPSLYMKKFDDLAAYASAEGDTQEQMFVYTAFFVCGPRLYRDAFAAFLKDVAATGDCDSAQKKHLLSLDQDKLRDAAQKFAEKDLKPVKPK
jgi:hypothetical protein